MFQLRYLLIIVKRKVSPSVKYVELNVFDVSE